MNLTERDQNNIWHPYTQHKTAALPIAITRGEGALLWDENNKEYIESFPENEREYRIRAGTESRFIQNSQ